MPEPKTRPTRASVAAFLKRAATGDRLADARRVLRIMEQATGKKGVMWGDAIIGFDARPITYADGSTLDWPVAAFSPRKSSFVFYIAWRKHTALLKQLGKHKTAGGCLHITRLSDVDEKVLAKLVAASVKTTRAAAR